MKKKVLSQRLYEGYFSNYSKKKVYKMVNFLIDAMKKAIFYQEGLKISGFGSFRKRGKRIIFKPSKKVLQRLKYGVKRSKM